MKRVRLEIANRTARLTSAYDREALLKHWSYAVPGYRYMSRRFPNWDGRIKLLKYDRVPAGLFWATRKEIKSELGIKFKVENDYLPLRITKPPKESKDEKYKFQTECVQKMLEAQKYGGGLVLNATGTGKTRIAAMLFGCLRGKCIFVVDQLDLLEQARDAIQEYLGEKVGYVGNSIFKPRRITIATVQTMHLHAGRPEFKEWVRDVDAVVIDEIHVQMGRRNFDVVKDVQPRAVFGLTATLQMKQKPVRTRAWAIAGPVVFEYPLQRGMESGVLSKGVVIRVLYEIPRPDPFDRDAEPLAGPQREYERVIVTNPERNSIISKLARYGVKHGKYVIVLVERIRHLKMLSKRLQDVEHRLVFGEKKVQERIKAKKKFEKGKVRLILANKVFKKGVDIRRVDVIIDGAGLKSKNDALQKFGRGVRLHHDKEGLLYFDIDDVDPMKDKIRSYNRNRKRKMKLHSQHRAASSRKRAFVAAGIPVSDTEWEGTARDAYRKGEKLLRKVKVKAKKDR